MRACDCKNFDDDGRCCPVHRHGWISACVTVVLFGAAVGALAWACVQIGRSIAREEEIMERHR